MSKFTPLGDKVLIMPDSATEVSEGGIILSQAKESDNGTVIKVSPDKEFSVKEGDRVKFMLGQGMMVEGHLLIEERYILLKYE